MKRALCYMMDGSKPVTIFDKTYQPADIPTMVYYKFKDDNEFIDINSINFYEELPANPDETVYQEAKWCSKNFEKPEKGDKTPHVDGPVKVLLAATGLMADYDYSSLFGELQHGSEISSRFVQYEVGNKTVIIVMYMQSIMKISMSRKDICQILMVINLTILQKI